MPSSQPSSRMDFTRCAMMRTLVLILWLAVLAVLIGVRFRSADEIQRLIRESVSGRPAVISGELVYEFENSSLKVDAGSMKKAPAECWVEWGDGEQPWWLFGGDRSQVVLSGEFRVAPDGRFGHMGGYRCAIVHPRVVVPPMPVTVLWMMLATVAAFGALRLLALR